MILRSIRLKIKKVEKLKIENTNQTEYKFDSSTSTLYVPISETNFGNVFASCINLREIEFSIDNAIETALFMFYGCINLEYINFTKKLNLINASNLHMMFGGCTSLKMLISVI